MSMAEWNDPRLDDLAQKVRDLTPVSGQLQAAEARLRHIEEAIREGARKQAADHRALQTAIEDVERECETRQAQLLARLTSMDDRREIARTEMRKVIVQASYALVGTFLTVAGAILVAVLT